MTLVGSFTSHHLDPEHDIPIEKFDIGTRQVTGFGRLLDMATYFVGEHGSRGLTAGSALVLMMVEKGEDDMNTWEFVLPSHEKPLHGVVGHLAIRTITEINDGNHSMFADRSTLTYTHANMRKRLDEFVPFDASDTGELGLVQAALEDWLLEDKPVQVVPAPEVS